MISPDRYNRSRINTVTVAAITSNKRLASEPGNVILPGDILPEAPVVDVTALFAVDRGQLIEHGGDLPAVESGALDDGLRLALVV